MKLNPLHLIDSYKLAHRRMYPGSKDGEVGTTTVYSNFTARSGNHSNLLNKDFGHTVFVGLQGTLKRLNEIWQEGFFDLPIEQVTKQYNRRIKGILGAEDNLDHIVALHELGYLPIEVRALEEGTLVPYKVPYFTIHNTHPDFYWLTNYLEDFFSAESWKVINNATLAYELRSILTRYSARQGLGLDLVPWQGHDFAMRGMSGVYDGTATPIAHLASFSGSDSLTGIDYVEQYYNADVDKQLVSGSVPASEHSVMCAYGEESEVEAFRRLMEVYPTGLLSIVSDSWDFFRVITEYAEILKDEIMARDGKIVYRPDSGDPADIICGTAIAVKDTNLETRKKYNGKVIKHEDRYYEIRYTPDDYNGGSYSLIRIQPQDVTNEMKGAVQCLWDVFGGTMGPIASDMPYRTLDSHVGLIYGDSINAARMNDILQRLENAHFAANNVVFGIGSYSYNMSSRDTHGMAMKATYVVVDGESRNIQKDPKTGDGTKKSATGLLRVVKNGDKFCLQDKQDSTEGGELKAVYRNGKLLRETSLSEIRKKLWNWDDSF